MAVRLSQCTCDYDACKDPALAVLDGPAGLHELLYDGHAAGPLEGPGAVLVVAVPATLQEAVLVLGVDLCQDRGGLYGPFLVSSL